MVNFLLHNKLVNVLYFSEAAVIIAPVVASLFLVIGIIIVACVCAAVWRKRRRKDDKLLHRGPYDPGQVCYLQKLSV